MRKHMRNFGKMMLGRAAWVLLALTLALCCGKSASAESDSAYMFDGEGAYYITDARLGYSLYYNLLQLSQNSGSPIGSADALFWFASAGDGAYYIRPLYEPNRYLTRSEYGSGVEVKSYPGSVAIPAEAVWRVIKVNDGVRIVNVATGGFLCSKGFNPCLRSDEELAEAPGTDIWTIVSAAACGTSEASAVQDLPKQETSVVAAVAKSAQTPLCEFFGFAWRPFARAEDFSYVSDDEEIIGVMPNGNIEVRGKGETTVTARHRYSGKTYSVNLKVSNNAIIIVPGFMGSELTNKDGDKIWCESLLNSLSESLSLSGISKFMALSSPASGDGITAFNNYFGALDLYKNLYRTISKTYKQDYSIEFYAYDWRRSSETTGKALAAYLKKKQYDNVVLIAHSFGGLVCAQALATDESLKDRVALACMIGVPVNGAAGVAEAWANDCFGNALGLGSFGSMENGVIRKIVGTLPSIYEMLPSAYAVEKLGAVEGCSSYSDFLKICKKKMGSFDSSLANTASGVMSKIYKDGVCVLDKIPVKYYAGNGAETVSSMKASGGGFSFSKNNEGDGLVALAECVAGVSAQAGDVRWGGSRHLWIADDDAVVQDVTAEIGKLFQTPVFEE